MPYTGLYGIPPVHGIGGNKLFLHNATYCIRVIYWLKCHYRKNNNNINFPLSDRYTIGPIHIYCAFLNLTRFIHRCIELLKIYYLWHLLRYLLSITNNRTKISPSLPLFFSVMTYSVHLALVSTTVRCWQRLHRQWCFATMTSRKVKNRTLPSHSSLILTPHLWADWSTIWLHWHIAEDRGILHKSKEGGDAVINRDSSHSNALTYEWKQAF